MVNARLLLLVMVSTVVQASTISYTGMFTNDDDVQLFSVVLPAANTVTIRTWSFSGGVNGEATAIPAGGFAPDIFLFDPTGSLLQWDSPESPDHAAPNDCGPRTVDPVTGFCWDAYVSVPLSAGSYTVALTQDGNVLADGYSLSGGFTEQGIPNYTDVNGLGGKFYLPDGLTERDGNWAVDISGVPATGTPEPATGVAAMTFLGWLLYRRR